MAKTSMIQKNLKRQKIVLKYRQQRSSLMSKLRDRNISPGERFELQMRLAKLPRNSSRTRIRNRCLITGRPRGYVGHFAVSRIMFRQLASAGMLPGVVKYGY